MKPTGGNWSDRLNRERLKICELMARLRKDMAVVEADCCKTWRLIIESRRELAALSRIEAGCDETRRLVIESRRELAARLAALESRREALPSRAVPAQE